MSSLLSLLKRRLTRRTINVERRLIVAESITNPSGYTWTVASALGHILTEAEEMFGPRDYSYTPLGVEFTEGNPRVWYPGDCKHIVIQLNVSCLKDTAELEYQLSHECIHLLAPTGGPNSIVLEEGVAMIFSERHNYNDAGRPGGVSCPSNYADAYRKVS